MYLVIGEPLLAAATQLIRTPVLFSGIGFGNAGDAGDPTTIGAVTELAPAPFALIACTANVYVVPFVSPNTVCEVAVLLNTCAVRCPKIQTCR